MRVVILGARGMLGTDVVAALDGHDAVATDATTLDITDPASTLTGIERAAPDVVINCAAYTAVARAEQEEERALRVNAGGARNVARACARLGVPLIHISTDYVFDGRSSTGYAEDAPRNPINAYGRTKAAGEEAVLCHDRVWLVRTSWLFGRCGTNFIDTMLRLGSARDEVSVVDDQVGCPTYTRDLAAALVRIASERPPFGIYHFTNDGRCSWYELAVETFHQAGLRCRVKPISTEAYGDPTPRPRCSVLLNTKLPRARPWQEALAAHLAERG